jgi:glycosyltransferase involved in cell wall biosynthesis
MENILLLTKHYPFSAGEAFIENEIRYLSKCFRRVTIIACEITAKDITKRTTPDNAMVYQVKSKRKKLQFLLDVICGISHLFRNNRVIQEELKYAKGIWNKLFLCYFEQKSKRIYDDIVRQGVLSLLNEKYVLYSYWFFVTARVGALIKTSKPELVLRMVTRAHRYDLYDERCSLGYLPMRRYLLRTFDRVCPCSDNGTQYLRGKYPEFSDKIQTSFLGTHDHGNSAESDDGLLRILTCSRVSNVKRIDRMIDTLLLLEQEYPNLAVRIQWTHIGDGKLLNKLKRKAETLNKVQVYFTGMLLNQEVLGYYKSNQVDIFINISSSEGLPVSIMEALSFHIPVIATDVGGTSEIVNSEVGFLIDKDFSNDQLAMAIRSILLRKDSGNYQKLRMQARSVWEKKYQADHNYTEFCALLRGGL